MTTRGPTKFEKLVAVYQQLGGAFRNAQDPALIPLAELCENYVAKLPGILKQAGSSSRSAVASGMEQGLRDMSLFLPQDPEQLRRAASAAFHSSIDAHFPEFFTRDEARLSKILSRGRIRTEREWYLVRHRVDVIEGDATHESELNFLYRLLDEFEGAA